MSEPGRRLLCRGKIQTVMMAPATGFYSSSDAGQDEVRLAYVLKKEDLEAAIKCLEVALATYPGRTVRHDHATSAQ